MLLLFFLFVAMIVSFVCYYLFGCFFLFVLYFVLFLLLLIPLRCFCCSSCLLWMLIFVVVLLVVLLCPCLLLVALCGFCWLLSGHRVLETPCRMSHLHDHNKTVRMTSSFVQWKKVWWHVLTVSFFWQCPSCAARGDQSQTRARDVRIPEFHWVRGPHERNILGLSHYL